MLDSMRWQLDVLEPTKEMVRHRDIQADRNCPNLGQGEKVSPPSQLITGYGDTASGVFGVKINYDSASTEESDA
jgi:hypothetical protein